MARGLVFDIYRGTTHDGPGLRTTVFLKGCPLRCLWCQNPEGMECAPVRLWSRRSCIGCLACVNACPHKALAMTEGGPRFARPLCGDCFQCVAHCPALALKKCGEWLSAERLLERILRDRGYFESFAGGVTVSGGEPLLQAEFVEELFRMLRQEGISTALDTCGEADFQDFRKVLPYTDVFLYDMKLFDPGLHRKFTGRDNLRIRQNILELANSGCRIWVRTPLVPGITATRENIRDIGHFLMTNMPDAFERWELCAFNTACAVKYEELGRKWPLGDIPAMTERQMDEIRRTALAEGVPDGRIVFSGVIKEGARQS